MTADPLFPVDPWSLRETRMDLDALGQSESLFALSNGHIGLRGTLDEGEPHAMPGSYLNSVYELRPLPHAEAGYGYPESGQTMINVTDGKLIRLLVGDEPFDVRYGELRNHDRVLDFRDGTLRRSAEWVSPAGQAVRVRSTRLVSLTQRAIAAVTYEVEPVDQQVRVVLQSELVANEQLPKQSNDPRTAAVLAAPLAAEDHSASGTFVSLVHSTRQSGLRVAAAMDHLVDGPESTKVTADSYPETARVTITSTLEPGQTLRVTKFIGYGWSSQRSLPALRDQVAAAISLARDIGWDALAAEQRLFLDEYWERADVQIEGDTELQQAIRFALFHIAQVAARAERRPISAKGLTGPGYDGHAFWDTETHVLPVLIFTMPEAAADVLRWRHATLDLAKERATQLGLKGASFPWRTLNGEECSGYWPAGTAAFHVNADIADAVMRYVSITEDSEFERTIGLDLLVETARMWRSLGHHDLSGKFRIDGVTGPDEYSAIADNNVYTNLMAQRNLRGAADAAERHVEKAKELGVDAEEMASWRDAASAMLIPFDDVLGVHPQSAGFTRHQMWDFENTTPDQYPLLLNFPYFDLYRKQVVKQADLVLAMFLCPDAFTDEEKLKNFDYYEAVTTRDSSLSACVQSIMAAEVGHVDLAYDYLGEAALVDLHNSHHNTQDGLHMASLAGTWLAVVHGFGVFRQHNGTVSFAPRLPSGLTKISLGLTIKGRRLRVAFDSDQTTYELLDGDPIDITHYGTVFSLSQGKPETKINPELPKLAKPNQPLHCEPVSRLKQSAD
jgi:alpha,alpha-trehalose phosphorylase